MKANDLAGLVKGVTKRYSKQRKAEKRNANARARRNDAMYRSSRITKTEAAEMVMEEAYNKASSGGTLPAHARQIYYAARGKILEITGCYSLESKYFTQTLLPQFLCRHPSLTHSWKVVYDARGHLIEPHTKHSVPLGTIDVDNYVREASEHAVEPYEDTPKIKIEYPTKGVKDRISAILFIEKEGFHELFKAVKLAEKYDLAIMSTKGQSVIAARHLVDEMCNRHTGVPVIIFHDFDKHGVEIGHTLTEVSWEAEEAGRVRYQFRNDVKFIDAGLWLADVEEWGLEAEAVRFKGDFILETRASKEDQDFLRSGRRVELNAFTSEDFIKWIESKLAEHGIKKVIPDEDTLQAAYRRAYQIMVINNQLEGLAEKATEAAEAAELPADLNGDVERRLKDAPTLSWDAALASIAEDAIDEEENNLG